MIFKPYITVVLLTVALASVFLCLSPSRAITQENEEKYFIQFESFVTQLNENGRYTVEMEWGAWQVVQPPDQPQAPVYREVEKDGEVTLRFFLRAAKKSQTAPFYADTLNNTYHMKLELPSHKKGEEFTIKINIIPDGGIVDATREIGALNDVSTPLNIATITVDSKRERPEITTWIRKVPAFLAKTITKGKPISYILLVIFALGAVTISVYYIVLMCNPKISNRYLRRWYDTLQKTDLAHIERMATGSRNNPTEELVARTYTECKPELEREEIQVTNLNKLERRLDAKVRKHISELMIFAIRLPFEKGKQRRSIKGFFLSLDLIWDLGVIAPMLGLLGTVVGISSSFGWLNVIVGFTPKRDVLDHMASDINVALFTTIAGLIVGIIFMLAYYLLHSRILRLETELWRIADAVVQKTIKRIARENIRITCGQRSTTRILRGKRSGAKGR